MKQLSKLEERLMVLNNEIIGKFCEGTAGMYANMDTMTYKPGSVKVIIDLLSRRNEIIDLLKDDDAGN